VFVLASRRHADTPDHVVTDHDPARLLVKLRDSNKGGHVHLVGGPRTIEAFHALGALDKLGLIVLPLLVGGGLQLPPSLSSGNGLTLESQRAFPDGSLALTCRPEPSALGAGERHQEPPVPRKTRSDGGRITTDRSGYPEG